MEDKNLNEKIVENIFIICSITGTIFWVAVIMMGIFKLIEILAS